MKKIEHTMILRVILFIILSGSALIPVSAQEDNDFEVIEESSGEEISSSGDGGGAEEFEDFEDVGDSSDEVLGDTGGEEFADESFDDFDSLPEEASKESIENALTDDPIEDFDDIPPLEEEPKQPVVDLPEESIPSVEDIPLDEPNVPEFQAEAAPVREDNPNYDYERKLHDIYQNYHNSPTSDETWAGVMTEKALVGYDINAGESLWSISQTLFGDGNYWPKVWSLNDSIQNPHLIKEGNGIKFILGDENDAPSFSIVENTVAEESAEEDLFGSESLPTIVEEGNQVIEIPPPRFVSKPVLKSLPPSLPAWQLINNSDLEGYDDQGVSYQRRKILDVKSQKPLTTYVVEEIPDAIATVEETEVGSKIASTYQYVFVKANKGKAAIGDVFLAVQNRGQLKHFLDIRVDSTGYVLDIQGEIQLIEKVKSEFDGVDMFRAIVKDTISPIQTGSHLIRGKLEYMDLEENGKRSQVVAQIIGGDIFARRKIFTNEAIVFLNRGSKSDIAPGEILPIRTNQKITNVQSKILTNVKPIGWLKVLKVTPNFSTAVILRSWEEIHTGDLTGAGSLQTISLDTAKLDLSNTATASDDENFEGDGLEEEFEDAGEAEFKDDGFGDDAEFSDSKKGGANASGNDDSGFDDTEFSEDFDESAAPAAGDDSGFDDAEDMGDDEF